MLRDRLFAGVSIPSFLSYRKNSSSGSVEAYHSFNNYDVIFTAGGLIVFSDALKFKPSLLIDYSLDKTKRLTQFDINGNLIIGDLYMAGRILQDI